MDFHFKFLLRNSKGRSILLSNSLGIILLLSGTYFMATQPFNSTSPNFQDVKIAMEFGISRTVNDLSWNPNSKELAIATDIGVFFWDGEIRNKNKPLSQQDGNASFNVTNLAYNPSGTILAIGLINGLLFIYDIKEDTLTQVSISTFRIEAIGKLAWSPNGQFLALIFQSLYFYNFNIGVWNNATSRFWDIGAFSEFYDITWSRDSRIVGFANRWNGVMIFDVIAQIYLDSISDYNNSTVSNYAQFSPDSKIFAVLPSIGNLTIYETEDWTIDSTDSLTTNSTGISWYKDSKILAIGSTDEGILLWDVLNRRQLNTLKRELSNTDQVVDSYRSENVEFSKDGTKIVTSRDNEIWIFEIFQDKTINDLGIALSGLSIGLGIIILVYSLRKLRKLGPLLLYEETTSKPKAESELYPEVNQ